MVSKSEFEAFGFSSKMGPQLRQVVEQQLKEDLLHYGIANDKLSFDWSDSCLEGHDAEWLDGHIENFSGIVLLDQSGQPVVEGWMEFIVEGHFLLVYWDYLTSRNLLEKHQSKKQFGIPPHVWNRIPLASRPRYATYLMCTPPLA